MFKEKKKKFSVGLGVILAGLSFFSPAQAQENPDTAIPNLIGLHVLDMAIAEACFPEMGINLFFVSQQDMERTLYRLTGSHRKAMEIMDEVEPSFKKAVSETRSRIDAAGDPGMGIDMCIYMTNEAAHRLKRAKIEAGLLK